MIKRSLLIITLILTVLCLASCAEEETSTTDAYPPLTVNTLSGNTATAEDGSFRITYLKDEWTFNQGFAPFTLYYTEDIGNGSGAKNINVQNSGRTNRAISEKDLEDIRTGLMTEDQNFMVFHATELRTINGRTVIYIEAETKITDEALDRLIGDGTLTEEDITASGGREVLKSIPATKQMLIFTIIDKNIILYTASYYDDTDKQHSLDTVAFLIENTECK